MTLLSDFAANVYSQHGEDGVFDEIRVRVPGLPDTCVEFGAAEEPQADVGLEAVHVGETCVAHARRRVPVVEDLPHVSPASP